MKNLSLKLVGICLVFFAGIAVATAQAVQVAEPPSSANQNWDAQHLKQNQQDLADQNSGNDDNKFLNMQNQQNAVANGAADADADAVSQTAAMNPSNEDIAEEMEAAGFLPIPGFTYTGDEAVDAPAYEAALAALLNNDAAMMQLEIDDKATFDKL